MGHKILVTGATGTIGSFVVEYLKDKQVDFVAMVRDEDQIEKFSAKKIHAVVADLSDRHSLNKVFDGISKLFLLSATSPSSPELQGNAVKEAKKAGIKHIVKVAARGSDKNADFNIGRWHGITEEEIRLSGIPYTFLHAHTFMQNLLFDVDSIQHQNAIYSTQGDGKIPMIDARDIAAVAAEVLTQEIDKHADQTYELTGPEAISYNDIAAALTELLGRQIQYIKQTPEAGQQAMLDAGMPEWMVDDMIKLNKRYARNEAAEVSPDVLHVVGRKPYSLNDFLQYYKERFK